MRSNTKALSTLSLIIALSGVILNSGHGASAQSPSEDSCSIENGLLCCTISSAAIPNRSRLCLDSSTTPFHFEGSTFTGEYKGPYARSVGKRDMIWIADDIHVSSPLRSNGGDIMIVANSVTIEAPIDSRVYFYHGMPRLPQEPYEWIRARRPDYIKAYHDYYTHCVDCDKNANYIPELPGGVTPWGRRPDGKVWGPELAGLPPPATFSLTTTRSGDIHIVAAKITVAKSLEQPTIPPDWSECTGLPQTFVPFALNAGGLRGGRGGAGTPSPCVKRPSPTPGSPVVFQCPDEQYSKIGELNALGGKGGDAGNVFVTVVGSKNPALESLLAEVTNVAGGAPGSSRKVRTPASEGPYVVDGTRCSFRQQPGDWPSQPAGTSGSLTINTLSSGRALQQVVRLLSAKGSRVDYDLWPTLLRANYNRRFTAIHPSDTLTLFLGTALARSESRYISQIDDAIVTGNVVNSPVVDNIFTSLVTADIPDPAYSSIQLVLLRELERFNQPSEVPSVLGYARKSGGLLNLGSDDALRLSAALAARIESNLSREELARIKTSVTGLNRQLFDHIAIARKAEFEARLRAMEDAIQKATAAAEEANDPWGAIKNLAGFAQGIQKAVTGFLAGEYIRAVEGLIEAGRYGALLSDTSTQVDQVPELQRQLRAILAEYARFSEEIRNGRAALIDERAGDLARAYTARAALQSKLRANSAYFADLVRLVLLSYLTDPFRDTTTLRMNLAGLQTLFTTFPAEEPLLRIRRLPDMRLSGICGPEATPYCGDCMTFKVSTRWRTVYSAVRTTGGPVEVPLYVIAPSTIERRLPLYGACVTRIRSEQPPTRRNTVIGLRDFSGSAN